MDNYIVISFVGEGSFGRVFKAKHKDTDAVVALKVIRKVWLICNLVIHFRGFTFNSQDFHFFFMFIER